MNTMEVPLGTRETYQKTLMKALAVAGDETALARKLRVPVHSVVGWLLGEQPMPTDIFLRTVDIVLAATKAQNEATREMLDEIKRKHRS